MLESHLTEETYNKWPKWQDVYVDIKILSPRGCLPLPRVYVRYKSMNTEFKEIFFLTCNKWAKR